MERACRIIKDLQKLSEYKHAIVSVGWVDRQKDEMTHRHPKTTKINCVGNHSEDP